MASTPAHSSPHVSIPAAHATLGRSGQRMFARPISLAQVYLAAFAAEHILAGRRPRQYDIETGLAILAHTDPSLTSTFTTMVGPGARRECGAGAVGGGAPSRCSTSSKVRCISKGAVGRVGARPRGRASRRSLGDAAASKRDALGCGATVLDSRSRRQVRDRLRCARTRHRHRDRPHCGASAQHERRLRALPRLAASRLHRPRSHARRPALPARRRQARSALRPH